MSLYFTTLFAMLTTEMVILFLVVLPLPFRIRKVLYNTYYKWTSSKQFQTVYFIFAGLVGLLFADSWKRAQVKVSLYHHKRYSEDNSDPTAVTPIQALASRAYNQRNVYISGFILYFMVCIPTVMTIVRRLVKYQNLINQEGAAIAKQKPGKKPVEEKEIDDLTQTLKSKETSLAGLQQQVKNLEDYFDKQNDKNALNAVDEKIKKDL